MLPQVHQLSQRSQLNRKSALVLLLVRVRIKGQVQARVKLQVQTSTHIQAQGPVMGPFRVRSTLTTVLAQHQNVHQMDRLLMRMLRVNGPARISTSQVLTSQLPTSKPPISYMRTYQLPISQIRTFRIPTLRLVTPGIPMRPIQPTRPQLRHRRMTSRPMRRQLDFQAIPARSPGPAAIPI